MKITHTEAQCLEDDEGNEVYLVKDPYNGVWLLLWPDDETANSDNYAVMNGIASMHLSERRRINRLNEAEDAKDGIGIR